MVLEAGSLRSEASMVGGGGSRSTLFLTDDSFPIVSVLGKGEFLSLWPIHEGSMIENSLFTKGPIFHYHHCLEG